MSRLQCLDTVTSKAAFRGIHSRMPLREKIAMSILGVNPPPPRIIKLRGESNWE